MDGQSYSGIHGYSDVWGGGGGWTSLDYPWMVMVTLAYRDTLMWGRVDIPGLSVDGQSYSGIRGYSDMGVEGGHPWTIRGWSELLRHTGILSRGGWTWTSLDYPWMVTVTLASTDTLTW